MLYYRYRKERRPKMAKKKYGNPALAYNLEFKRGNTIDDVPYVAPTSVVQVIKNHLAEGWVLTCVTAVR